MIPLFKVFMSDQAIESSSRVLSSGFIGQGEHVNTFESSLSQVLGVMGVLSTNSATSAEHLIYHCLRKDARFEFTNHLSERFSVNWNGLDDSSEVLATPLTCTATNWPILANNLKIKWVDIDPQSLTIDFCDLRRKLSPTTRIISIVHWGGYPADLHELRKIQLECYDKFGHIPLIVEDCAHALGSYFDGHPIGSHGNFCTFSFQAIKHCTSVDGGALVCPDLSLARRAKLLRWYGIDREENRKDFRCEADIPEWGFKFHMNDVCATIGNANLSHLNHLKGLNSKCRENYNNSLVGLSGITLIQQDHDNMRDINPWLYSILVEDKARFMASMNEKGIMVSQVHERNDKHSCVSTYQSMLPSLDSICSQLVCIPCGWWVTSEDQNHIIEAIKQGW